MAPVTGGGTGTPPATGGGTATPGATGGGGSSGSLPYCAAPGPSNWG
jgi:hypothetical protein